MSIWDKNHRKEEIVFSLNKRQGGWKQVPEETPTEFMSLENAPPSFTCVYVDDCSTVEGECYESEEACLASMQNFSSSSSSSSDTEEQEFFVVKKPIEPETQVTNSSSSSSQVCDCDSVDEKWGSGSGSCLEGAYMGSHRTCKVFYDDRYKGWNAVKQEEISTGSEEVCAYHPYVCSFRDTRYTIDVAWTPPGLVFNKESTWVPAHESFGPGVMTFDMTVVTRGMTNYGIVWQYEYAPTTASDKACLAYDGQGECIDSEEIIYEAPGGQRSFGGIDSSLETEDRSFPSIPVNVFGAKSLLKEDTELIRETLLAEGHFSTPDKYKIKRTNDSNSDFSSPDSLWRFTTIRTDVEHEQHTLRPFGVGAVEGMGQRLIDVANEWVEKMDQDWQAWIASGGTDWVSLMNQWFEDKNGAELIEENLSAIEQERGGYVPGGAELWRQESMYYTFSNLLMIAQEPQLCSFGPWPELCPEAATALSGGSSVSTSSPPPTILGPSTERVEKYGVPPNFDTNATPENLECVTEVTERQVVSGPHPSCVLD